MTSFTQIPPPPPPHLNIAQKAFKKIAARLKAPYVPQNYQRKLIKFLAHTIALFYSNKAERREVRNKIMGISDPTRDCFRVYLHQKAGAKILEIFDLLCREHGLTYWLGAGNLLGIVRHHGNAVPWDDDVDVYLLRQDWEKATKLLPELFNNSDLAIINRGFGLKFVRFRQAALSFDIFPIDQYHKKIDSPHERESLPVKFRSAGLYSRDEWENAAGIKGSSLYENGITFKTPEKLALIKQESKIKWEKDFMEGKPPACDGHLVIGFERAAFRNKDYTYTWDYNWVFPLKRATFMGVETNVPNNIDLYLKAQYGDYWTLPKSFHCHAARHKMTAEAIESLIELANLDAHEFVRG